MPVPTPNFPCRRTGLAGAAGLIALGLALWLGFLASAASSGSASLRSRPPSPGWTALVQLGPHEPAPECAP